MTLTRRRDECLLTKKILRTNFRKRKRSQEEKRFHWTFTRHRFFLFLPLFPSLSLAEINANHDLLVPLLITHREINYSAINTWLPCDTRHLCLRSHSSLGTESSESTDSNNKANHSLLLLSRIFCYCQESSAIVENLLPLSQATVFSLWQV